MIPLVLLLAGACTHDGDTGPADTGDPPPLCDDGPHEATECGFHQGLPEDWDYRRFQNDGEGVDVILVREVVGFGPGETTRYDLRGFALVKDGCLYCMDDADVLSYETGHHNWMDDADCLIEGVTHRLHVQYQPEDPKDWTSKWVWSYWLVGLDPGTGDEVWGPIDLDLTEGDVW